MPNQIYLASKSPRRRQILAALGYVPVLLPPENSPFQTASDDELRLPGESARDYVVRTAKAKALQAFIRIKTANLPLLPVVAADTTVVLGEEILRKPHDEQDELQILRKLSARTHVVRTAVAVGSSADTLQVAVSESSVVFDRIPEPLMKAYARTVEPYDKAGGYAVQGLAGIFIKRIEGSYSGVVGLPVHETVSLLCALGHPPPALKNPLQSETFS